MLVMFGILSAQQRPPGPVWGHCTSKSWKACSIAPKTIPHPRPARRFTKGKCGDWAGAGQPFPPLGRGADAADERHGPNTATDSNSLEKIGMELGSRYEDQGKVARAVSGVPPMLVTNPDVNTDHRVLHPGS